MSRSSETSFNDLWSHTTQLSRPNNPFLIGQANIYVTREFNRYSPFHWIRILASLICRFRCFVFKTRYELLRACPSAAAALRGAPSDDTPETICHDLLAVLRCLPLECVAVNTGIAGKSKSGRACARASALRQQVRYIGCFLLERDDQGGCALSSERQVLHNTLCTCVDCRPAKHSFSISSGS
jgi:hypothetical protein